MLRDLFEARRWRLAAGRAALLDRLVDRQVERPQAETIAAEGWKWDTRWRSICPYRHTDGLRELDGEASRSDARKRARDSD
jgi:hypothetical protein